MPKLEIAAKGGLVPSQIPCTMSSERRFIILFEEKAFDILKWQIIHKSIPLY